jgi:hypothetical protein
MVVVVVLILHDQQWLVLVHRVHVVVWQNDCYYRMGGDRSTLLMLPNLHPVP